MTDEIKPNLRQPAKVFDVAQAPSSKPKIVTQSGLSEHSTHDLATDPGVSDDETSKGALTTQHQLVIQPPDDFDPNDSTDDSVSSNKDVIATKVEPATKTEPTVTLSSATEASDNNSQSNDANDKATDEQVNKDDLEAQKAKQAYDQKVNTLIEHKTYFLEIGTITKRRNVLYAWIGVAICVVLIIAWLDVALDAGIINNSFHLPHTHFFELK